jgi:hypothetical protein
VDSRQTDSGRRRRQLLSQPLHLSSATAIISFLPKKTMNVLTDILVDELKQSVSGPVYLRTDSE